MPYLLSEDFVRNKLGRMMAGRDERLFRDSKLTGFALRVRRAADGTTFSRRTGLRCNRSRARATRRKF